MKFKLLIVFTFISLVINFHLLSIFINNKDFLNSDIPFNDKKVHNKEQILTDKVDLQKKKINRNFFPQEIQLKDYSTVKYTLENDWKNLIKTIREHHTTPSLIDKAYKDKEVCSGFIWSLSEKIWWEYIPYYIWMMNPQTKTPAKAWELLNSYSSFWWKVLIDFSSKIEILNFKDTYWWSISKNELLNFFNYSFSEKALLWDIWFLYKNTKYINFLVDEWVFNSHIVKNMGLSEFTKQINFWWNFDNHELVLKKIFNIKIEDLNVFESVLSSYMFYLNWKEIIYKDWEFYYLYESKYVWDRVDFKVLDSLSYKDVTIAHYYDWKWRVDSLLNFVFWWDFLPINVMTINSRFVEKM